MEFPSSWNSHKIFQSKVIYVDHVLSATVLSRDPRKVEAITALKPLTNDETNCIFSLTQLLIVRHFY